MKNRIRAWIKELLVEAMVEADKRKSNDFAVNVIATAHAQVMEDLSIAFRGG